MPRLALPLLVATVAQLGCGGAGEVLLPVTPTEGEVTLTLGDRDKIDVLFLVDDSPSMTPKQDELKARFPELLQILDGVAGTHPASFHIGVVTSDLGSGPYPLCNNSKGARLQARGAAADPGCAPPTGGVNFIDYDQRTGATNLPPGQDLATTFSCMASVGANGCGFEHQLEAVYRALHDPIPENHDFLRPDALLLVVFLTDEDDCSAPDDGDLFDPAKVGEYGILASYRCTRFAIACPSLTTLDHLMPYGVSGGNVAPCADADPSVNKLIPVQKYIDFFTRPAAQGGVKQDPRDVLLFAIAGPDDHVESIIGNPQTVSAYQQCTPPEAGYTNMCAPVLQRSCETAQFFGDPAVRLRQVVSAARHGATGSVCDDSYGPSMQSLGALLLAGELGCLDLPFADPSQPDCQVSDETLNPDGTTSSQPLPRCVPGGLQPCWDLQAAPDCPAVCARAGDPAQRLTMTVRRTTPRPPSVTTRATCQVLQLAGRSPACAN